MIRSGTLLIQKGTKLPASVVLEGGSGSEEWTAVESGAALLELKAKLAAAGWNCFYMGAVKQTVTGGLNRIDLAMKGIAAKMRLNECNSLLVDAVSPYSKLGVSRLSVSAHCCHIQQGVTFSGGKQ